MDNTSAATVWFIASFAGAIGALIGAIAALLKMHVEAKQFHLGESQIKKMEQEVVKEYQLIHDPTREEIAFVHSRKISDKTKMRCIAPLVIT